MLRLLHRRIRKLLKINCLKMISFPQSIPLNSFLFKLCLIWIINMCPPLHHYTYAQESSIEQMEEGLKNIYGLDKLKTLNKLTQYYQQQNLRKALKYGKQAVALGEDIFVESNSLIDQNKRHHLVLAYFQLGKAY